MGSSSKNSFDLYQEEAQKLAAGQYLRGRCFELAYELHLKFPELEITKGHYRCPAWGDQPHWWCVTPSGEIIDPTSGQFPSAGSGEYVPWPEGAPEPTGKCPNCGEYCYDNNETCTDKCFEEYASYLMKGT